MTMWSHDDLAQLRQAIATDHNLDWRTALDRLLAYAIGEDAPTPPPPAAAVPAEPAPPQA